jgi:hypothetical protein
MNSYRMITVSLLAVVLFAVASQVFGDPLPGEVLKFQQLPLDGGVPVVAPYLGPFIGPNPLPVPVTPLSPAPSPFAPFPGHDELSTAYASAFDATNNAIAWQGQYMADDFADRFTTPVLHVRWWGSYLNNNNGQGRFGGVKQFLISFESDVPAVAGQTASHPGTPILNQIVTLGAIAPGSGTFTETPVPGAIPNPTDGPLYQYNAELNLGKAFPEQPNTVYWLKIVALVNPSRDGQIQWGWHDRDWSVPDLLASVAPAVVPGEYDESFGAPPVTPVWHFQDDAVAGSVVISPGASPIMPIVDQTSFVPQHYIDGIDGPTGISQYSKDLAFELYTTVPEPISVVLLGLGGAAVALRGWRRK